MAKGPFQADGPFLRQDKVGKSRGRVSNPDILSGHMDGRKRRKRSGPNGQGTREKEGRKERGRALKREWAPNGASRGESGSDSGPGGSRGLAGCPTFAGLSCLRVESVLGADKVRVSSLFASLLFPGVDFNCSNVKNVYSMREERGKFTVLLLH